MPGWPASDRAGLACVSELAVTATGSRQPPAVSLQLADQVADLQAVLLLLHLTIFGL